MLLMARPLLPSGCCCATPEACPLPSPAHTPAKGRSGSRGPLRPSCRAVCRKRWWRGSCTALYTRLHASRGTQVGWASSGRV